MIFYHDDGAFSDWIAWTITPRGLSFGTRKPWEGICRKIGYLRGSIMDGHDSKAEEETEKEVSKLFHGNISFRERVKLLTQIVLSLPDFAS